VQLDTDGFDGFHFTGNCVKNAAMGPGFFCDGNRNVGLSATRGPLFDGNLFENQVTNVGVNIGSRSIEDAVFSNNVFRLNAFDGLQGGPSRTMFSGNTFESNGRSGLLMTSFGNQTAGRGSSNVTVQQNCFFGNGLTQSSGGGLRFASQPDDQATNVFNDNDFVGNTPGAENVDTDTIDGTNNYWGAVDGPSGVGPGSGDSVSGSPDAGPITFDPFSTAPHSTLGSLCNPVPTMTPTRTSTSTPSTTPTQTPTRTPTQTDIDNDGVANATEDACPSAPGSSLPAGDGNGDDILDSLQANVSSLPTQGIGQCVTLVTTGCDQNTDVRTYAEDDLGDDRSHLYPYGLIGFRLCNNAAGICDGSPCSTAQLKVTFFGPQTFDDNFVYRKHGPLTPGGSNLQFYTLPGVTLGMSMASFTLNDGQLGDDSGVDGFIVDQGGPAVPVSRAAPVTSSGGIAGLTVGMLLLGLWGMSACARGGRGRSEYRRGRPP